MDNGSKIKFHLDTQTNEDHIIIIRSEENKGFSGGFNIGIREALAKGADYILIINNDTQVFPDMMEKLLRVFDSDPAIAVAIPKIYFAKGHEFHKARYKSEELGKVLWYAGGYIDWDNVISTHRGVDEVDHGQYDKIESTEFATGCCMLLKKEALERVGLFDERYFLYYEDADLSVRLNKAGLLIYYVPAAMIYHFNSVSSGGPGNKLHDYFLTRNQMLFGFAHASMRSKIALIKQSIRLLFTGRYYQRRAIIDFYLHRLGKGTFFTKK